tara:strand:+ start:1602 stop:2498 length:897 start_codon:yes stop_codon:yes gene_type:complete
MQFDVVATNPPFQDSTNRKRTQHKLWIDFTQQTFDKWLKPGGILLQVSPSSFLSPSNKILKIFQSKAVKYLHLDTKTYFPKVGSTFADYMIRNEPDEEKTEIVTESGTFHQCIDSSVFYLPIDVCEHSLSIHRKVIFNQKENLDVRYDYVNCHNVNILRNTGVISKTKSDEFVHPILHTNKQIWYSKARQQWAAKKKVMWSRSGYTKPFYDDGVLGGTDMAYYVPVPTRFCGENLVHNMNSKLIRYILTTAKWSGFGNEKVFRKLPNLPVDRRMTDAEMYLLFGLNGSERNYVENYVG